MQASVLEHRQRGSVQWSPLRDCASDGAGGERSLDKSGVTRRPAQACPALGVCARPVVHDPASLLSHRAERPRARRLRSGCADHADRASEPSARHRPARQDPSGEQKGRAPRRRGLRKVRAVALRGGDAHAAEGRDSPSTPVRSHRSSDRLVRAPRPDGSLRPHGPPVALWAQAGGARAGVDAGTSAGREGPNPSARRTPASRRRTSGVEVRLAAAAVVDHALPGRFSRVKCRNTRSATSIAAVHQGRR